MTNMEITRGTPPWLEGIEGDAVPRLIMSDAPVIRVVAGPGSGKTTGLRRRVQRLIEGGGVDPTKIFVGTFTRAITADLVESLGEAVARGIRISTLHSQSRSLLVQYPGALRGRRMRFMLQFEEDAMLCDVRASMETNPTIHELRRELNRLQSAWADRRDLGGHQFAGSIDRWLRSHSGMLIGEIVPLATEALQSGDIPRGLFDHVIVDEYQDLTQCEQEMVQLIWSGNGSLVVLGDDDQSIYGFRFNHPEGINGFGAELDSVEDIHIPENWRSGRDIVDIANILMAEAGSQKPPMDPRHPQDGSASLVQWESVDEEIRGLGAHIQARSEDEFLVLVPRRFIGHRLQELIGEEAQTSFYQEVVQHPLVQERFTLASLLASEEDAIATRAWLGLKKEGPEAAPKRNAGAYSNVSTQGLVGRNLLEAIASGSIDVSGQGSVALRARVEEALVLLDAAPANVGEQIDYVFDDRVADQLEDEETKRWVTRDIGLLREAARMRLEERDDQSFSDIIDNLRYRIATRTPLTDQPKARVQIMTLHSAKGLEGDSIIVCGLADQMIPGFAEDNEAEREEQRRLLYVAVTRAREELVLSWPRSVKYSDAASNNIAQSGGIFTSDGERLVRLSKTAFLPASLGQPEAGPDWLGRVRGE